MRNYIRNTFAIVTLAFCIISLFVLYVPVVVHGQTQAANYIPISPITDPNGVTLFTGAQTFSQFLQNVYSIGIAAAFGLGVIMLTLAGFNYVTTEKAFGKDWSRKQIENAFIGIAIALASYILLAAINSNLTTLSNLCLVSTDSNGHTVSTSCLPGNSSSGTTNSKNSSKTDVITGQTIQNQSPTTAATNQTTSNAATLAQVQQKVNSLDPKVTKVGNISNDQAIQWLTTKGGWSYSDLMQDGTLASQIQGAKQSIEQESTVSPANTGSKTVNQ